MSLGLTEKKTGMSLMDIVGADIDSADYRDNMESAFENDI